MIAKWRKKRIKTCKCVTAGVTFNPALTFLKKFNQVNEKQSDDKKRCVFVCLYYLDMPGRFPQK